MNWVLTRRDAALRYVGRWVFVGPLVTLTFMGVIASIRFSNGPAGRTPLDVPLIVLTLWVPAAIYTWVTASERRCSRFDMELPIASRELWTAHTAALLLAGFIVLAATAATLLLVSWAVGVWAGLFPPVYEFGDLALAVPVVAVLLLSVALAQSVSPSLERVRGGPRVVLAIVAGILAGYLVCLLLAIIPLAVSLVPAAVAVWLLWRTRDTLPGTFVVAPLAPDWFGRGARRGPPSVGDAARAVTLGMTAAEWRAATPARGALGRAWALLFMVFRSTTKMPVAPIVGLPLLLAAGLVMSGVIGDAVRGDDSIRFSMLFLISYMLLSFTGLPPRKLHVVDALPVSRRALFALMFLPYVATVGLGYGAGRLVADRVEDRSELVSFIERDGHQFVSAPLRYGAVAMDGTAPEAVAPWGESHEVWSTPVWGDAGPLVHSRFSTPPGSSAEFVAWQISRAVADVYGRDIDPELVRERYLTVDASGEVGLRGGELTLAADHPKWSVRPFAPVFPVMMLLVCGLWLLALALYLRTLRPGFREKQKRGAFWWGMVALMALHVSQFVVIFKGGVGHWTLSGALMVAVRELANRLPGGSFTVWLLCGVLLYGLYRMAESRFLQVESLPGDDMRISLIERPIGAAGSEGAYAR